MVFSSLTEALTVRSCDLGYWLSSSSQNVNRFDREQVVGQVAQSLVAEIAFTALFPYVAGQRITSQEVTFIVVTTLYLVHVRDVPGRCSNDAFYLTLIANTI
uniref:Uncharacterized protein n=1 Tax=Parascaris equorum TaxID=6256 RepID=A0A914S3K4_PAREQ